MSNICRSGKKNGSYLLPVSRWHVANGVNLRVHALNHKSIPSIEQQLALWAPWKPNPSCMCCINKHRPPVQQLQVAPPSAAVQKTAQNMAQAHTLSPWTCLPKIGLERGPYHQLWHGQDISCVASSSQASDADHSPALLAVRNVKRENQSEH